MDWRFPAILLVALLLGIVLSLWQNRAYAAEINTLARAFAGNKGRRLVSGAGKGRLRGAVVVLVVDTAERQVLDARAMTGATIFSRLRPAPSLVGGLDDVIERATSKKMRLAIENALKLLPAEPPAPAVPAEPAVPAVPGSPVASNQRIKVRSPLRNESK